MGLPTGLRGTSMTDQEPRQISSYFRVVGLSTWLYLLIGGLFTGGSTVVAVSMVYDVLVTGDKGGLWPLLILCLWFTPGSIVLTIGLRTWLCNLRLLRRGKVKQGVIQEVVLDRTLRLNHRASTRITWEYDDRQGKQRGYVKIFDPQRIEQHPVGAVVQVLHDDSGNSVVPSLLGVELQAKV